jgi:hypothetical protein
MTLNGWQRMWVVLAAVWLSVVLTFAVGTRPTRDSSVSFLTPYVSYETFDDNGRFAAGGYYDAIITNEVGRVNIPSGAGRDEAVNIARRLLVDPARIFTNAEADQRFNDRVSAHYRDAIREHILIAAAFGVIPLAVLYAFGGSVAWIRRGFRGGRAPESKDTV